jgi:hypothetical protein
VVKSWAVVSNSVVKIVLGSEVVVVVVVVEVEVEDGSLVDPIGWLVDVTADGYVVEIVDVCVVESIVVFVFWVVVGAALNEI